MREPTENEVAAALVAVEIDTRFADRNGAPLIEETIGPAEVFSAPDQPEYVTVLRKIWVETCTRCLDNELRAARLQEKVDALQLQIEAHEVVGAAKDADYDELMERCEKAEQISAEWIGVFIAWVAGCGLSIVARCI